MTTYAGVCAAPLRASAMSRAAAEAARLAAEEAARQAAEQEALRLQQQQAPQPQPSPSIQTLPTQPSSGPLDLGLQPPPVNQRIGPGVNQSF